MPQQLLPVLPGFFIGAMLGLLAWAWTWLMVKNRSADPRALGLNRPGTAWIWPAGCGLAGALIAWHFQSLTAAVFAGLFLVILVALSVTDLLIRKIPNEALLALIIVRLAQLLIQHRLADLPASLAGLAAGYFFFLLPTLLKMNIGNGDVKLAAVIGFCLGIFGMILSVLVMGLLTGIMTILLLATHRGNLKTKIPLGPFLSTGMFIMIFLL